jgi:peptidoglycan-associated lipoprotein
MTQEAPPPEPPAAAPPAEPAPSPRTLDVAATSVYFAFDSSELSPETRAALQTFSDVARQQPGEAFRIEGNCDERGSREYNLALGQRRADAAKSYLVNLGLAAPRITTISYGKERPRAPGHDEAAWTENRRDDLLPAVGAVSQAVR